MSGDPAARRARIRGSLEEEPPDARAIEHLGRNPDCDRLQALTLAGISTRTAARHILRELIGAEQSPLAIGAGNRFEETQFGKGAARLLDLYRTAGRLALAESKVTSIPLVAGDATPLRRAETLKLLRLKLAADPAAPNIVVKPRLVLEVASAEVGIEPDALVAGDGEPFYRVVEVKSYPDRRSKTDPGDLRNARRQAAVGVEALRQTARRLGVADAPALVPLVVDLVLRRPDSYYGNLSETGVEAEHASVRRALEAAPGSLAMLDAVLATLGPSAALDDPAVLEALPFNYLPSCRDFCALHRHCKRQAMAAGDPVLLGRQAREELAAAGSIPRALELLEGMGAPPRSQAERTLQARLREAAAEFAKAVI